MQLTSTSFCKRGDDWCILKDFLIWVIVLRGLRVIPMSLFVIIYIWFLPTSLSVRNLVTQGMRIWGKEKGMTPQCLCQVQFPYRTFNKKCCLFSFLVPTVLYNSPQMHLYGRTHYARDYVDKSAALKVMVKVVNI